MQASEAGQVGNLDEVVASARRVASQQGAVGLMRWGRFTAGMGGVGAWEALTSPQSGSTVATPFPRYVYTCRCGLIDMRHFYQLMYISLLRGEDTAIQMGDEHERNAEAASRYAPEDMTSNALGAEFGAARSVVQRQSTFVSELRSFLAKCDPVDWHKLSAAKRACIVKYYAVDADGGSHRRQTAGSDGDPCGVCVDRDTSFPFTTDSDNNQITGERE